jgi:hypothetical protein
LETLLTLLHAISTPTHATAHAILVANVAPVTTSTTANVSVAIVLVIHLLGLLLGVPLSLLPVHVVHSLGFYQLVNLTGDTQGVTRTKKAFGNAKERFIGGMIQDNAKYDDRQNLPLQLQYQPSVPWQLHDWADCHWLLGAFRTRAWQRMRRPLDVRGRSTTVQTSDEVT